MTDHSSDLRGLLPFYVNGTVSPSERAAIETALEQDPELRAELDATRALYADMKQEPLPYAGDTSFVRLMKAIDSTPQDPVDPQVMVGASQRPASPILKVALAASLVALVVQALVFWRADPGVGLASGVAERTVTVAFQPDATEAEIRALLTELDLQIVSGPSSLGLYQLSGGGKVVAIQALTTRSDIVESAENAMD